MKSFHTTAKATKTSEKDSGNQGNLEYMRIEPAANGFVAEHRRKKKATRGNMAGPYEEPERHVFDSPEELGEHVRTSFGGKAQAKAEPAEEPAENA